MNPQLEEIVRLARQLQRQEMLVNELEGALKDQKESMRRLSEEDLPAAMMEAQLSEFVLDTGEKVTLKKDFSVGIPAARREEAWTWLTEKGYDALIKTAVTASFGKGEIAKAEKLVTSLAKQNYTVSLARDVHWQTLKAFVVEQVREAKPIPLDLFGAVPINRAKIV